MALKFHEVFGAASRAAKSGASESSCLVGRNMGGE